MAHLAVRPVAIHDEAVAARLGLQHVRKVFRAHGGLLHQHLVRPHDAGHHLACKFGLFGAVDGRRVVAHKLKLARHLKRRAGVLGHLAHAPLDHVQHFNREGAHRAAQLATVGNDIGRLPGVDHGDRDHPGVNRLFVAADDGLKRLHHLAGHRHRVQPVVRQRGVAAFAPNGDFELVARRHHRPRAGGKLPHLGPRPVVHAKHRFHRKLLKQPVLDHLAGATATLFRGLKNQVHRAVKVPVFSEMLGCGQQHGGVAVMAAGVHLAGVHAGVAEGVELLHGQRVHVGAQANRAAGRAAFDNAHHAGGAQAAVNGNAPLGQLLRHHLGCAHFLEAQLGVGVNVTAKGSHVGRLLNNRINQVHGVSPLAPKSITRRCACAKIGVSFLGTP